MDMVEESQSVARPNTKRRAGKFLIGGVVLVLLAAMVWLWFQFHSIPHARDLKKMIRDAEKVEIFRLRDDKPVRWVRLADRSEWIQLADEIVFRQQYWQFSLPPEDVIVFQVIRNGLRYGAWEVRGDGCLHIRKSGRWYRMYVDPGFEKRIRAILATKGEDLKPSESPTGTTGPR